MTRVWPLLFVPLAALVAVAAAPGARGAAPATPTFSEDVAPILYRNCVTCHRAGEAAPFALITYADAQKHGKQMAKVTKSRYMPPWHAAHGFGEFADERRLTDAEIATIDAWFAGGMPAGDAKKLPPLPKFPEGWHLGTPDLVLKMPAAFDVPASGADVYRNFVIATQLTEDRWVRAIEFRPSARKAVHHVLFAYDATGTAAKQDGRDGHPGFGGMGSVGVGGLAGGTGPLGGWAVGATPQLLPDGVALALPKGSDIILQMHFHPTGKPETEQSTIGVYFADRAPERRLWSVQLPALFGFGAGIDIPPGRDDFTIEDSFTLPVDVRAFSINAHAHYIAKEMKATATLPDGVTQPLLWIPDWDFAWQDRYTYKTPVLLPKGTRIDARLVYDNTDGNPHNPQSPPVRVQWGEQSFDEMGSVILAVQTVRKEDEPALQAALGQRVRGAIARGRENGTLMRVMQERAGRGGGGSR
jgi:mono/diheme cytochrome c family protein